MAIPIAPKTRMGKISSTNIFFLSSLNRKNTRIFSQYNSEIWCFTNIISQYAINDKQIQTESKRGAVFPSAGRKYRRPHARLCGIHPSKTKSRGRAHKVKKESRQNGDVFPAFWGGDERVCAARKALRAEQARHCYVGPQLHNPVHTKKAASLDDLFCLVELFRPNPNLILR